MIELVVGAAALPLIASILLYLWRRPPVLVGAALLSALFVRSLTQVSGLPVTANVDDAMIALTVVRAIWSRFGESNRGSRLPGWTWFVLFSIAGILSGVIAGAPPLVVVAGCYLAMKGILFGWASAQFRYSSRVIRDFATVGARTMVIILISGVLSVTIAGPWARVFTVGGLPIVRFGLASATGVFPHPFDFAFAIAIGVIGAVAYRHHVRRSRINSLLIHCGMLATVVSFRRKDLVGLLFARTVLSIRSHRWYAITAALVFAIGLSIGFAAPLARQIDNLRNSYFSTSSTEARTQLVIGSVQLADSYAPLGAGFGRFGSETAAAHYSPEYNRLGLNRVYGLGPGPIAGAFLTDTSWPAILGESGFAGLGFFICGLLAILREFRRKNNQPPYHAWLQSVGLGVFALVIIESSGAAIFTSPPGYPFLFALAGIFAATNRELGKSGGIANGLDGPPMALRAR